MSFPLQEIRLTTRRPRNAEDEDALPLLYPRLIRDNAMLPKLGIAIGYFESMVGKERREFDPELLVQFFADHKLARCIVSSMARRYRFRPRLVEEVVTATALKRMRSAGLDHPRLLRLDLYDRANSTSGGFLCFENREAVHTTVEQKLRLRRGELERLLHLDADEHAVLERSGNAPEPTDVVRFYNFDVLDTLLRRSEQVDLALGGLSPEALDGIRAVCAENGVHLEVKSGTRATLVRLRGRQDSMGIWSRHGRRVSRAAVEIVRRHRASILDAGALVALKHKRACLKLTPDLLEMLDLPLALRESETLVARSAPVQAA
jgi:predicted nuclease of restriction endonuclease-like RecB superfamily